ncbi:MAG TPA: penicillin-binding transpeptidase domain-containing protein, partial [Thermoleophilia bacterium]|nr:penicillin-binding transpeptidase domain-containing protein [Thermoleophilia bacterium]
MNRGITRVFIVGLVLFAGLIVNVTYVQFFRAEALKEDPANHRPLVQQLRVKRGLIVGFDDSVIAGRVRRAGGIYQRTYPQGPVAPQLVGYSTVQYGRSGLEQSMNPYLSGTSPALGPQTLVDQALGRRPKGANVKVTLVPEVQKVAQRALGSRVGGIVALDPATGALIAAASAPSYDPAALSQPDPRAVRRAWKALTRDPGHPLLGRATQGLYPPGSSFKVVTATAALDSGAYTPESAFDDTGTYHVYGGTVSNFGGNVFGPHTLAEALTLSINTTFAKIGVELGQETLTDYMVRYGFYQVPPVELPRGGALPSGRYVDGRLQDTDAPMDPLAVAWMAVGQERLLATPLQMALVAAAVANGGTLMKPYVVQEVVAAGGRVVESARPAAWHRVMSGQTAATLNTMMQDVINAGTGTGAALQGIQVAGKTGTAERGNGANQAWFIGFAPAEAPRVAV